MRVVQRIRALMLDRAISKVANLLPHVDSRAIVALTMGNVNDELGQDPSARTQGNWRIVRGKLRGLNSGPVASYTYIQFSIYTRSPRYYKQAFHRQKT